MVISPVAVDKPHLRQCSTAPCVLVTQTYGLNCLLFPDIMGCDRVTGQSVCILCPQKMRENAPEFRPGGIACRCQAASAGAEVTAKLVPKSKNWTPEHGSRGMVLGGRDAVTLEPELRLLFFFSHSNVSQCLLIMSNKFQYWNPNEPAVKHRHPYLPPSL